MVYLATSYGVMFPSRTRGFFSDNVITFRELLASCHYSIGVSTFNLVYLVLINSLQTLNILLVTSIVLYKRTEDILQGISKLDYLLKVSVFQKYKDPEIERAKFSIKTTKDDLRISENATFWRDESKRLNYMY